MNITSKSKYALRAVIHLARTRSNSARREDLAAAQGGISMEYLEKILIRLREARVLTAKSGPGGGYRLARPAEELTAWDVIKAVEGSPAPVACLDDSANHCSLNCEAKPFWERVWHAAVMEMQNTSISSLAAGAASLDDIRNLPESERMAHCR